MKDLNEYAAVIFDFDGTLVDSLGMWQKIDDDYLGNFGIEVPSDLHEAIAGMSFDETADYFKKRFDLKDSLEDIKKTWNDMSFEAYEKEIGAIPGALDFVEYLNRKEMPVALATSNIPDPTNACLTRLGLSGHFQTQCFTGGDIKGKPDPAVYLKAAESLGVDPSDCLAFEDTLEGVQSAKAAGMDVMLVKGDWSEETTRRLNAEAPEQIGDYHELLEALQEMEDFDGSL